MMMTLFYILAGIALFIIVLAILAPKSYDVSRSIAVNKPKNEIFEALRSLKKMGLWVSLG